MKKKPGSYLANGGMASVVLCYALELSESGRTTIDWVVIGLVCSVILWNVVQLGRRLHAGGGSNALWFMVCWALAWMVGLMNTAWIRAEDVGSWKNWTGRGILVLAIVNTMLLANKERGLIRQWTTRPPGVPPNSPAEPQGNG